MKILIASFLLLSLWPASGQTRNFFPHLKEVIDPLGDVRRIHDVDGDGWDDTWTTIHYRRNNHNAARDRTLDSDGDGTSDFNEMLFWMHPHKQEPLPKRLTLAEQAIADNKLREQSIKDADARAILQAKAKLRVSKNLAFSRNEIVPMAKADKDKALLERFARQRSKMPQSEKMMRPENMSKLQRENANMVGLSFDYTGAGTQAVLVEVGSLKNDVQVNPEFTLPPIDTPFSEYSIAGPIAFYSSPPPANSHATKVASVIMANGYNPHAKGFAPNTTLHWLPCASVGYYAEMMSLQVSQKAKTSNHSYGFYVWRSEQFNGIEHIHWVSNPNVSMTEPNLLGQYNNSTASLDEALNIAMDHLAVYPSGNNRKAVIDPDLLFEGDVYAAIGSDGDFYLEESWLRSNPPNPGYNTPDGLDTLGGIALTKNGLVVGAIDEYDNLWIHSSSGPTDDLRIKPDIVAMGSGVVVTHTVLTSPPYVEDGPQYSNDHATSLAAPAATGSALLLEEARTRVGKQPMHGQTKKALLIHSARKKQGMTRPDPNYGYGILDTRNALSIVENDGQYETHPYIKEIFVKDTVWSTFDVKAGYPAPPPGVNPLYSPTVPLVITICWNDLKGSVLPSAWNTLDVQHVSLRNNLDIEVIDGVTGESFHPWRMEYDLQGALQINQGLNSRDNVEQVTITAVTGRNYTVRIKQRDGTQLLAQPLSGSPAGEDVSIIFSGIDPEFSTQRKLRAREIVQVDSNEYAIEWDSVVGMDYRIEKSLDLQSWTVVEDKIRAPGDVSAYVVESLEPRAFFRVALDED